MKALKTVLLAKSIAAALVAGAGIAAPTISHASPDDGMVCRAGYGAQSSGGNIKCTRQVVRLIPLDCPSPIFKRKLIRTPGIPGDTTGGLDMCLKDGVVLGTQEPATGVREGFEFIFATVNQSRVAATREAVERATEIGLGLPTDGVDSRSVGRLALNQNNGEDMVEATITLFTFPIAAPDVVLPPLQLDAPVIDARLRISPVLLSR
jgi:hypothetical protein